ncbi:16S rRNA (uracil(1498)-N(3))-methyltransferase [Methylocaldum gracile]|jgi:16S rRNA (uracil1498-N3)-methyltransferase|uniref:16S rRNA (uracil(1498)-N(3))-methyltransferase n=1 Tax=unclassified Methylocaldum TaxID=2622260 RepID=UPI001060D93B
MRVSRLYLPQALEEGSVLQLDEESAHYLRTVLRLKKGTDLTVFNGDGREYSARVATIARDEVRVEIGDGRNREVESPLTTHLGLGISRGERMDLAIQKAVELGVSRITPLFTEHCVVRLDDTRRGSRRQHWRKVAHSACEQCGRNRVPEVEEPIELKDWVVGREGLRLFFDPQAAVGLKDLPRPEGFVSILSGPEGGFAEKERVLAREAGFVPVRLGPRILRTETAVLAALSAIQAIWGDLG